jgi:hypothetical protein
MKSGNDSRQVFLYSLLIFFLCASASLRLFFIQREKQVV